MQNLSMRQKPAHNNKRTVVISIPVAFFKTRFYLTLSGRNFVFDYSPSFHRSGGLSF